MPFRYTQSPLKLTNGDPKGLRRFVKPFGSNFICWKAVIYIMSAELPLSISTLQVLNSSMASIMTRGSSWGCLIPFTSCSEKTMSSFSMRGCFAIGWLTWTLFTCLYTTFLRDLYDPPKTGPLVIVLITPTMGLRLSRSSSLWSLVGFSSIRSRA